MILPDVRISWPFPEIPESQRVRELAANLSAQGFDVAYVTLSENEPYIFVRNPERERLKEYLTGLEEYHPMLLEDRRIL